MILLWQNSNDAGYYTLDGDFGMVYVLLAFIALVGVIAFIKWVRKKIGI